MEENYTLQEQIEKYLDGLMSDDERMQFEAQLESDQAFAAEVASYALARKALAQEARSRMRQQAEQAYQNYDGSEKQQSTKSNTLLRIAAAVALLVALGAGYFWMSGSADSPQELYAAYYAPVEASASRAASTDEEAALQAAVTTYKNKDFDAALGQFQKLTESANATVATEATLFLGACFLEKNQPEKTIETLAGIDSQSVAYFSKAQWYTALAHLLAGHSDKAAETLKTISTTNKHYKQSEATELLEKLNR